MIGARSGKNLTEEEKWNLIGSGYTRIQTKTIKTCKPDFIGGLYCDIPFPCFDTKRMSIKTDEENIFNGSLNYKGANNNVTMKWTGYVSQLRDGELKMAPISESSTIEGECNGISFKMLRHSLIFGVWPGFLLLYTK